MNNNLTRRKFLESALSVIGISILPTRHKVVMSPVDIAQDGNVQDHEVQSHEWCHERFWIDFFNRDADEAMCASQAMIGAYMTPSPDALTRAWGEYREPDTRGFLRTAIPDLSFADARTVASLIRFLQFTNGRDWMDIS